MIVVIKLNSCSMTTLARILDYKRGDKGHDLSGCAFNVIKGMKLLDLK